MPNPTETATPTCPKCGAEKTTYTDQCSWTCGTYQALIGRDGLDSLQFEIVESDHCRCRQELTALRARLAEVERENERLKFHMNYVLTSPTLRGCECDCFESHRCLVCRIHTELLTALYSPASEEVTHDE